MTLKSACGISQYTVSSARREPDDSGSGRSRIARTMLRRLMRRDASMTVAMVSMPPARNAVRKLTSWKWKL